MRPTFAIATACAILGTTATSSAQPTITSVNRSVSSHVHWNAYLDMSDSESASVGPVTIDGQWDAVAAAYANDVFDWGQHVITEQHSIITPNLMSADITVDLAGWPSRPSLGAMTLRTESHFDFGFTITEPTPVTLDMTWGNYTHVLFYYSLKRVGGGFSFSGDSPFYGNIPGIEFEGVLSPGSYVFTSSALRFIENSTGNFVSLPPWNATVRMTALPAPSGVAPLAIGALPCIARRRRSV